jgi:hypothetical protein
MADSHPFSNAGLSQFGGERGYTTGKDTGLGAFAAAYLAHKTGLIDLNDPKKRESVEKNGVLGHLLNGYMSKAVAPKGPGYGNNFNPAAGTGVSNDGNADIGGGFNPAGIAPTQLANAVVPTGQTPTPVIPPSSGNAGMDMQLSSAPQEMVPPVTTSQAPMNFHDFDADISNYAGMMGLDDLGSIASVLV